MRELWYIEVPDQAFWILCGLFYLYDNIYDLDPREFLLSEDANGRWKLVWPHYHFRIRRRALTVPNVLLPSLTIVRMRWLTELPFTEYNLRRSKRVLNFYQCRLRIPRILSVILFVTILVVGPLLTYLKDLESAFEVVLPLYLVSLCALSVYLVKDPDCIRLSRAETVKFLFECGTCPGFFINVCRRISFRYIYLNCDAIAYVLKYELDVQKEGFCEALEHAIEEIKNDGRYFGADEGVVSEYFRHLSLRTNNG